MVHQVTHFLAANLLAVECRCPKSNIRHHAVAVYHTVGSMFRFSLVDFASLFFFFRVQFKFDMFSLVHPKCVHNMVGRRFAVFSTAFSKCCTYHIVCQNSGTTDSLLMKGSLL